MQSGDKMTNPDRKLKQIRISVLIKEIKIIKKKEFETCESHNRPSTNTTQKCSIIQDLSLKQLFPDCKQGTCVQYGPTQHVQKEEPPKKITSFHLTGKNHKTQPATLSNPHLLYYPGSIKNTSSTTDSQLDLQLTLRAL